MKNCCCFIHSNVVADTVIMEFISSYYEENIRPWIEEYIPDDKRSEFSTLLLVTGAAAVIVSSLFWRSSRLSSSKTRKSKKNAKKDNKKPLPLTLERQIENVSLRFKDEFEDGVQRLIKDFDANDGKKKYERNYYNEMLLKLLIELDGVDLVDVEGDRKAKLKESRKAVIRDIQFYLKKLDTLK